MKGGKIMKKFEAPVVELEKMEIVDVITTSGCDADCTTYNPDCEWET